MDEGACCSQSCSPPHDVIMHTGQGKGPGKLMVGTCAQGQEVRTLRAHGGRVGALAWGGPLLASGSWDRTVRLADVRAPGCGACLGSHASEVCGLKARPLAPCMQLRTQRTPSTSRGSRSAMRRLAAERWLKDACVIHDTTGNSFACLQPVTPKHHSHLHPTAQLMHTRVQGAYHACRWRMCFGPRVHT